MAQLNRCIVCQKVIGDNVSTCPHCGANQNAASKRGPHGNSFSRVPAIQTTETKDKFREIENGHKRTKMTAVIVGIVSVVGGLGALATPAPALGLFGFLGLIVSIYIFTNAHWTSEQYYSLPGSRDAHGKHRCIHCGHIGIFNKGEYATNNKHSGCSKCEAHLFTGTRD
jgi:predicted  nucleic acid-binding Zn-ribbon protein